MRQPLVVSGERKTLSEHNLNCLQAEC